MINIAIIDDDSDYTDLLNEYLQKFAKEENRQFHITIYHNAVDFLTDYKPVYNIVLMDIEMPQFNGLEAARELRALDEYVNIIFVTNMGQLAVYGYEVDAVDFIVKPVSYFNFSLKLKKAIGRIKLSTGEELLLNIRNGKIRLNIEDIAYIEVNKHYLCYHTKSKEYSVRQTISDAEKKLGRYGFLRCNNCYLVNYKYVTAYQDNFVFLGDVKLQISAPRRKDFLDKLSVFLSGNGWALKQ